MGWFGAAQEMRSYLLAVKADRDEEGKILLYGSVPFVGLDGDVVVDDRAEYSVGGRRCNLACGLAGTSYGMRVKVF